jgi:hypothetical protein
MSMRAHREQKDAGMFAHARRLSRTVGTVPSMIWATIYLLCIPGFACLYTLFPDDAWQCSTIMLERCHKDSVETFEQTTAHRVERAAGPVLNFALQKAGLSSPNRLSSFVRYDPKLNPTLEMFLEYDTPRSIATGAVLFGVRPTDECSFRLLQLLSSPSTLRR